MKNLVYSIFRFARKFFGDRVAGKYLFFLAAGILFAWLTHGLHGRIALENVNNKVELCVNLREAVSLCVNTGYPLKDLLQRFRTIGVSSLALNEETIGSLASDERIIFYPASEYMMMRLVDLIPRASIVSSGAIATKDRRLCEDLKAILQTRYKITVRTRKAGSFYIILPRSGKREVPSLPVDRDMYVGFYHADLKMAGDLGFGTVLVPENEGDPSWLFENNAVGKSVLLWESNDVCGFPGSEADFGSKMEQAGVNYVDLEFINNPGMEMLKTTALGRLVRGHTISQAEMNKKYDTNFWISRWTRGVRERSIRFLYLHFWAQKTIESNLLYVRELAQALKAGGYILSVTQPPDYPLRKSTKSRIYISLVAAVFVPLAGLWLCLKTGNPYKAFFSYNLTTIVGGTLVSVLLFDRMLMQGAVNFPYVRVVMLIPLVASFFMLFPKEEIRNMLSNDVKVRHLAVGALAVVVMVIIMIRAGNNSAGWLQFDQFIREITEDIFIVRPRTKEFIFGQPLLFAGLYFRNPWMILIGVVGQVSMVNTFLHAHTPVIVSLLRSIYGIFLGFTIGFIGVKTTEWIKNRL
ncbi:MAG: hypothetical protein JW803_05110 [Endomicrobiales bacterium]|nr:hypothetical protein [Endomicrobiales bacterium]